VECGINLSIFIHDNDPKIDISSLIEARVSKLVEAKIAELLG
jgi:hypothetical protein